MYSFSEIIGSGGLIKNLKSAIKYNKVSHAYIFCGSEGSGKKLIAKTFAKALSCENGNACGTCRSCRVFDRGNHPDVFFVAPSKTKALSVEDIREQVIENVAVKPYKSGHKIYIIDKAETMTAAAQNAFLKTLEEPPEYAVFILLAGNMDMFLPTVLSRCVVFKINPLSNTEVSEYISKKFGVPAEEAQFLAEYAGGSIGKAVRLKNDENFYKMREYISDRLFGVKSANLAEVIGWGREIKAEFGANEEIFDIMYLWYRDLLAAKALENHKYIIEKDKADKISKQAEKESFESIIRALDAIWYGKKLVGRNVSFQLAMETTLMKIKEN